MNNKTLQCQCGSTDLKNLEPEKLTLHKSSVTIVKFQCKTCGKKFHKKVLTEEGKNKIKV
jgi:transposase-like protein